MIQKLRNMKVSKRLSVSYLFVLIMLVVSLIVCIYSLVNIGNEIEQFYEHPFQVSASADIINARFEQMQKSVFRAISTENEEITKEAIANAKEASEIIQENLEIIQKLYLGNQQDVTNLKSKLEELAPMREEVINLASQNLNKEAAAYMEEHNIPCIKETQEVLNVLIDTASNTGSTLIMDLKQNQLITTILLSVIGVFSVIVSIVFSRFITGTIMEPINQIEEVSKNLSNGILESEVITYDAEDECGSLARNMKQTISKLKIMIEDVSYLMNEMAKGNLAVSTRYEEIYIGEFRPMLMAMRDMNTNISVTIRDIAEASDQVAVGAGQMAESAQGLAEGATEQAGAVEELTATVESVADTAEASTNDAKSTSEQINSSAQKAEISKQEMEKLKEAMKRIDATSQEIVNIIASIEDIASQTNLLSLNASIEAARAGEAGKGFAVVADQIGKLASDSAQSAANTRELIIKTLDEIKVGNDITSIAADAFADIINEIAESAKQAEDISNKSMQQLESLRQVSQGIEEISGVIQNNSAAAEESSATSEELAAQSDSLKGLVGKFVIKKGI